jgi:hypothetical protein
MNFALRLLNQPEISSELAAPVEQGLQPNKRFKLSEERMEILMLLNKMAQEGPLSKVKMPWFLTEVQKT